MALHRLGDPVRVRHSAVIVIRAGVRFVEVAALLGLEVLALFRGSRFGDDAAAVAVVVERGLTVGLTLAGPSLARLSAFLEATATPTATAAAAAAALPTLTLAMLALAVARLTARLCLRHGLILRRR